MWSVVRILIFAAILAAVNFPIIYFAIYSAMRRRKLRREMAARTSGEVMEERERFASVPVRARCKYYEYLREEVVREDELTHQRLTWLIAFQGFMINAVAVLIGFAWPEGAGVGSIIVIRKVSLAAIPVIGLLFGYLAYAGIIASRLSLTEVKFQWEQRNAVWQMYPDSVPQAYGQKLAFMLGRRYAVYVSLMFIFMWQVYLAVYLATEWRLLGAVLKTLWSTLIWLLGFSVTPISN